MTEQPPSEIEPDDDSASAEFARALAEHERGRTSAAAATHAASAVTVGAKVHGRVVALGDSHAMIDIGGRSEAVVELGPFRADDGSIRIAVGDVLDLFVIEAGDQIVLAASLRTEGHAALGELRAAQRSGVPVSGRVTGVNVGGLEVDVSGVRSFCPLSQIELGFCSDPAPYVGKTLEFVVTAVEDGRGGAKLSRRQLLQRAAAEQAKRVLSGLKAGDTLDGTVARLEPFGAFVNLGGVDGLVHVSEIGHARIAHPKDALREGERVRVRVLQVETAAAGGKPRIALSIKATLPDPWIGIATRIEPGARLQGTVVRLADFGAFVTLAAGVDGLVHVSEAALGRVAHVKDVLAVGDRIEVVVLGVDPDKKRIALSVKQAMEGWQATEPKATGASSPPAADHGGAGQDATRPERTPNAQAPRDGARGPRGDGRPPRNDARTPRETTRESRPERRPSSGPDRRGPSRPPTRTVEQAPASSGNAEVAPKVVAPGPPELTPMAIALRKAMEQARLKRGS